MNCWDKKIIIKGKGNQEMNKKNLPISTKVLPTFHVFCLVVVQVEISSGQKLRSHLGKMRPIWAICMKSGQKCSGIGKTNFNHNCEVDITSFDARHRNLNLGMK